MYKFVLNGQDIENPKGWDKLTLNIRRNPETNFASIGINGELIFSNEAYFIIKTQFDLNGYCTLFPLEIWYSFGNSYQILGEFNIILSDVEFNIFRNTAKCKLVDNNWGTFINNNKSIKVDLSSTFSKNGVAVTPATTASVKFFAPVDGSFVREATGVSAYFAFQYIISSISDNSVVFQSDYFSTGAGKGIFLLTGQSIRTGGYTAPITSLFGLYSELNKKLRLGVSYYISGGVKYVRIEDYAYFYENSNSITLPNIKDIVLRTDVDSLYSAIQSGSVNAFEIGQCDNGDTNCTFGQIPFFLFSKEQLAVSGNCNIDKILDLTTGVDFVIDTNIIEDVLLYNDQNFERSIFLISANVGVIPYEAVLTDLFASGHFWYNDIFTNKSAFINWFQGLSGFAQNWITQYLTLDFYVGAPFQSVLCSGVCPLSYLPIFNIETTPYYDVNGNNNNGVFTVPYTGTYDFEVYLEWDNSVGGNQNVSLWNITTASTFVAGVINMPPGTIGSGGFTELNVFLQQGDEIGTIFVTLFGNVNITGGYFRVNSTLKNNIPVIPDSDFLAKEYAFNKFVSFEQIKSLMASPLSKVKFNQFSEIYEGWIKEATISLKDFSGTFAIGTK